MRYISSNRLKEIGIDDLFGDNGVNLDYRLMSTLRVALFPEIKIINAEKSIQEVMDIKALDREQEEFARRIPLDII